MKIKIKTTIELPDDALIKGNELEHAREIIYDSITGYVTKCHLRDATTWMLKDKPANKLAILHNNWADICEKLDWKFSVK